MRAIIKLGCVCKVNKIFSRLFNGKVSTEIIYNKTMFNISNTSFHFHLFHENINEPTFDCSRRRWLIAQLVRGFGFFSGFFLHL